METIDRNLVARILKEHDARYYGVDSVHVLAEVDDKFWDYERNGKESEPRLLSREDYETRLLEAAIRDELQEMIGIEIYFDPPEAFSDLEGYGNMMYQVIRASSTESFVSQVDKLRPDLIAGFEIEKSKFYDNIYGYALKQDS